MPDHPFMPQPVGVPGANLLAAGVQALDSYRRYATDQEMERRNQEAGLLQKGLVTDPQSGHVQRDPNAQAAYDQDLAEKKAGTPQSQLAVRIAKQTLQQTHPEVANQMDENTTSGYVAKQYLNQLKPEIQGQYGLMGKQVMGGLMGQRFDLQRGNQAAHAADTFDKDPNLQKLTSQQQNIQRGKHTLDTVETLTPQLFNEIQLDIANAISGGKAAAVSTQGKTEFTSYENEWKNFQQKLTNKPQDISSPETKKYISSVLDRLDEAYQNNMSSRAQQLTQGRAKAYAHNPAALDVLNDKANSYAPAKKGLIPSQGQPSSQDQQDNGGKLSFEDFKKLKAAGKL